MPKLTIIVDSHQLSEFQRCPRLYQIAQLQQKGTARLKDALTKGTGIHNLLYLYYTSRIKGLSTQRAILNAMRYMRYQRSMTKEHIAIIYPKVLQYFAHYRDELWKPLKAEIGFSKLLYEDAEHIFVYEGKIDLLVESSRLNTFVDHKSQSYRKELPQDSNQFLGYAWATGYRVGIINYINLSISMAPKDAFRREICSYSTPLIEEWKEGAIETCLQMAHSFKTAHYRKQRNGCAGQYGTCDFHEVCHQTNELVQLGMLNKEFIIKEKWSPWK